VTLPRNRWLQLAVMVLATVALSNMQYGWTLFVNPMRQETHWATAGIQFAFSILIFLNTWLAPAEAMELMGQLEAEMRAAAAELRFRNEQLNFP